MRHRIDDQVIRRICHCCAIVVGYLELSILSNVDISVELWELGRTMVIDVAKALIINSRSVYELRSKHFSMSPTNFRWPKPFGGLW